MRLYSFIIPDLPTSRVSTLLLPGLKLQIGVYLSEQISVKHVLSQQLSFTDHRIITSPAANLQGCFSLSSLFHNIFYCICLSGQFSYRLILPTQSLSYLNISIYEAPLVNLLLSIHITWPNCSNLDF